MEPYFYNCCRGCCSSAPAALRGLRLLLFASLLGCGLRAAHAQEIDPHSVAHMSLDQLLATEVSVATRTAESFMEAPSSVTLFTRREIRNLGIRTVEELLNFAPACSPPAPPTATPTAWPCAAATSSATAPTCCS